MPNIDQPGNGSASGCALIGVDWGTSSLRACAIDASGAIMLRHESDDGILSIADAGFGTHLEQIVTPWVGEGKVPPIVLSGMITSRQGWMETPYLDCPAPAGALAGALHHERSPSGWPLHFVTGLSCRRADGTPDVMRGEETQILGAGIADGYVVMPGTHSKWVRVEGGAVHDFTTFMTGELFASLREHTILGRLMTGGDCDAEAYLRGVTVGMEAGSGLLSRLFGVRSHGLFNDIAASGLSDYLSGLLIGTEFKEALAAAQGDARTLTLLGRGDLMERYSRAAEMAGVEVVSGPSDAAAKGQYVIARAAGLIQG